MIELKLQIEPATGIAINTTFKLTANWLKDSTKEKEGQNDESDSDDDDDDGLTYNFYYRPITKKETVSRKDYISLKTSDKNTVETVLPGVNGVRFFD